jgi:N-glycosylase/DNA lyase
MIYKKFLSGIILENYDSFDVEQTLECGQCFRFFKIKNKYLIVAYKRELNIFQTKDKKKIFMWPCELDDFKNIWFNYFDLGRNYLNIKKELSLKDKNLARAINLFDGIRILNQDPFECLISFIISQNSF